MRSVARFNWSGRLFQILAPVYEKLFYPYEELFFGILKSLAAFLKLYKELVEFATMQSVECCKSHNYINSFLVQ